METPDQPPVVPDFNKPDAPGVSMNFDNTVSLYQVVEPDDTFHDAARHLFALLHESQERFPDWPRILFVDIRGHRGEAAGFDGDFYEFQQEFMFSVIAPFVTGLATPLTGALVNPELQRNDLPDRLAVQDPGAGDGEGEGEA